MANFRHLSLHLCLFSSVMKRWSYENCHWQDLSPFPLPRSISNCSVNNATIQTSLVSNLFSSKCYLPSTVSNLYWNDENKEKGPGMAHLKTMFLEIVIILDFASSNFVSKKSRASKVQKLTKFLQSAMG